MSEPRSDLQVIDELRAQLAQERAAREAAEKDREQMRRLWNQQAVMSRAAEAELAYHIDTERRYEAERDRLREAVERAAAVLPELIYSLRVFKANGKAKLGEATLTSIRAALVASEGGGK